MNTRLIVDVSRGIFGRVKFSRPPTKTNPVSEQMTNYSGNIFIFATMGPSHEEYLKDLKSSGKAFHKTSSHFVYIITAT